MNIRIQIRINNKTLLIKFYSVNSLQKIKTPFLKTVLNKIGGERGIRTPGPFTVNSFQDCRIRPLCHLSIFYEVEVGIEPTRKVWYYFSEMNSRVSLRCRYQHSFSPLNHFDIKYRLKPKRVFL